MSKLPITTDEIEKRLSALEEHSHVPFDFTELIERIEALEAAVPANSRATVGWKAIKRACVVFCEKFDKGPFDELSVEDQQRLLTGMRPVIEAALPLPLENARHAKNLREVATILSTERIQGWANPLVCVLLDAEAALATPSNSRAKNSGEVVECEKCGGEGTLYTSKYGGNDPDVWPIGTCDECEGSGEVELELDMERDLSSDELDLISQGFENYKTAIPVAKIINDNQPGKTAIIEILCEPPTLGIGTELYVKPVLVRSSDTNSGQFFLASPANSRAEAIRECIAMAKQVCLDDEDYGRASEIEEALRALLQQEGE